MTAVIPEASTVMPPPDGRCIATVPTTLVSESVPVSRQPLRAINDSYCDLTTLLVQAGFGLHRLLKRDGGSDLELAYMLLQDFVIRPVDERASDEAENEAIV
ncbi:hypothetical protein ACGF3G_43605 [Streptomyces sp. NPDC048179]|uniref:hypothetical protein n=1 Tax=Streptomyces sp. NPDC048179 TaxID=3365506 RepID=UPI0037145B19